MSTTDARAPSQQNACAATQRVAVNLDVDLVNALRWPYKLLIEDVSVRPRLRAWHEHSQSRGEEWLRQSATAGDFYAMEGLGLRLFNGDGLTKSPEEGLVWLRRSVEQGNPVAMLLLAECLLETKPSSDVATEAEQWLERSIEHGNRQAAISLASRLIAGAGLSADPHRGKQLLVDLANDGSQLAHVKLGVCLLSGQALTENREEGLRWLRRIGATEANHMSVLAYYIYMKSMAASTKGGARILAGDAAVLLQEAVRCGNHEEAVNLAYLIRRGEISGSSQLPVEELLATYVSQERPFALINQALRIASGFECTTDWHVANILIGKIRDTEGVLSWWHARSTEGDAEGHLVTGWLVRQGLAPDPDQIALAQRMDLARKGGWTVPGWMDQPASLRWAH